jgi:hypothetical protein
MMRSLCAADALLAVLINMGTGNMGRECIGMCCCKDDVKVMLSICASQLKPGVLLVTQVGYVMSAWLDI